MWKIPSSVTSSQTASRGIADHVLQSGDASAQVSCPLKGRRDRTRCQEQNEKEWVKKEEEEEEKVGKLGLLMSKDTNPNISTTGR